VDASPLELVEVARICQDALRSSTCGGGDAGGSGHVTDDVSCAVAVSPPKDGEANHLWWGHITFPWIVVSDDDHNALKRRCACALHKRHGRVSDWHKIIDRAQCSSLRTHGSDRWDERNHVPMGRPLVKSVYIDNDGTIMKSLGEGWFCPLILPDEANDVASNRTLVRSCTGLETGGQQDSNSNIKAASSEELLSLFESRGPLAHVRLLLLCGIPGSGKSTFATALTECRTTTEWIVVNSDELGSRKKCEAAVRTGLKRKAVVRVCLDRCNQTRRHRSEFIHLGRQAGVPPDEMAIVHFEHDVQTCVSRCIKRVNHPTLSAATGDADVKAIVQRFAYDFEVPDLSEGAGTVVSAARLDEGGAAAEQLEPATNATSGGDSSVSFCLDSGSSENHTPLQQLLKQRGVHKFAEVKALLQGDDIDVRVKEMDSLYLPMYHRVGLTFGKQGVASQCLEQRVVDGCRGTIYEKVKFKKELSSFMRLYNCSSKNGNGIYRSRVRDPTNWCAQRSTSFGSTTIHWQRPRQSTGPRPWSPRNSTARWSKCIGTGGSGAWRATAASTPTRQSYPARGRRRQLGRSSTRPSKITGSSRSIGSTARARISSSSCLRRIASLFFATDHVSTTCSAASLLRGRRYPKKTTLVCHARDEWSLLVPASKPS